MKSLKLIIFTLLVLFLFIPNAYGLEIVIDPGHDGNQQNRGGPAFTVDWLGSELTEQIVLGERIIEVNDLSYFSTATGYRELTIGDGDTFVTTIDVIDTTTNEIRLSDTLPQTYPAGTSVTVQDFLIQAMGRRTDGSEPGSWDATAEYYDTLTYTHELPASQWDDWIRKEEDLNNNPLGTLEVLNTWRISKTLEDALPDTVTVHLTKDDVMDVVTRSARAQMYVKQRRGRKGERGRGRQNII